MIPIHAATNREAKTGRAVLANNIKPFKILSNIKYFLLIFFQYIPNLLHQYFLEYDKLFDLFC